jgi:hypothetical protein
MFFSLIIGECFAGFFKEIKNIDFLLELANLELQAGLKSMKSL